ncbi:type ISP restriction/modification enzyme [Nodularia chucula]|uniref:type ISP restriction/modification enzyme n=1 Tax=Nodularia chucula TaxID=3093667 RepID=UPI0039C5EC8F
MFDYRNFNYENEYYKYYHLINIFLFKNSGIKTDRDPLFVNFNENNLQDIIQYFYSSECLNDENFIKVYNINNSSSYDLLEKRNKTTYEQNNIKQLLYKPFDIRWIYYRVGLTSRPAWQVMQHMIDNENLGLISMRQIVNDDYSHFGVTQMLTSHGTFYLGNKGQDYIFPLYLYPDTNNPQELQQQKRPNFSEDFLKKIEINLGYLPTPEIIFYYIYAIFHSPTYRTRYAEFLKIDFPRVPLTSDNNLFSQLAEYGEELVALHLMKSPKLNNMITQFTENGGNQIVDAGHPKYNNDAVVINKKGDKFIGVPEEVWNFYIGGYQVCHKWLKDRKGRTLNDGDILHYQRVVVALKETMDLMQLIDDAIPEWPIQ